MTEIAIENLTADEWDARVTEAPGLVLVDFWGPRCVPCLALKPHLPRLMEDFPQVRLYALDSSQARRLCIRLRVIGLPTLVLYRDGVEVSRHGGNDVTAATVRVWLSEAVRQAVPA